MMSAHLLSWLIALPVLGGVATLISGGAHANRARWIALAFALATLAVCVPLLSGFDATSASMQFVQNLPWIEALNVNYHVGVDGVAVALIALTAFTTVLVLIGAWGVIDEKVHQYYASFLVLEGLMIGVFCSLDALLFYVFFEAMLIPMFIIIGIWGGPRRVYATIKFFLYTFLGLSLIHISEPTRPY